MAKGSDPFSMNANLVCVDLNFVTFPVVLFGSFRSILYVSALVEAPDMLEVMYRNFTCENNSNTQKQH